MKRTVSEVQLKDGTVWSFVFGFFAFFGYYFYYWFE